MYKYRFPEKQTDHRVQRKFHLLKNAFWKSNLSVINRVSSRMTYDYYELLNMFVLLPPIMQLSNLTERMPFRGLDTSEVEVSLILSRML